MENIGIHWIPLKISMLPFIMKEVDNVIERFYCIIIRPQQTRKG